MHNNLDTFLLLFCGYLPHVFVDEIIFKKAIGILIDRAVEYFLWFRFWKCRPLFQNKVCNMLHVVAFCIPFWFTIWTCNTINTVHAV